MRWDWGGTPGVMGVAGGLFNAKAVNEADVERERATTWEEEGGRGGTVPARWGEGREVHGKKFKFLFQQFLKKLFCGYQCWYLP